MEEIRMHRKSIHFLGLVEAHVLLDGVQHLERLARVLRATHAFHATYEHEHGYRWRTP